MSAGSFRGDAADSKNNGARDLLRRRTVPGKRLRFYRRHSPRNRDVTDRLKVRRVTRSRQDARLIVSLTDIREKLMQRSSAGISNRGAIC